MPLEILIDRKTLVQSLFAVAKHALCAYSFVQESFFLIYIIIPDNECAKESTVSKIVTWVFVHYKIHILINTLDSIRHCYAIIGLSWYMFEV